MGLLRRESTAKGNKMAGTLHESGAAHESSGDDNDEVDDEVPGTMVFQCQGCNTILGDTMAWVDGNTEMGTFTISQASDDVYLGKSVKSCVEGVDEGSTYKDVICASCKTKVGRYYLATTSGVDHLRKMYTLYAEAVKVYKLDSGEDKGKEGSPPVLSLYELTLHIRQVQGIILQICNQLSEVSKKLGIPMHPALGIPSDAGQTPIETASPLKEEGENDENEDIDSASVNSKRLQGNGCNGDTSKELSHSSSSNHHSSLLDHKTSTNSSSRKRERSKYAGDLDSVSDTEGKAKKHKCL